MTSKGKALVTNEVKGLNAWGQDAKTAKEVRVRLRKERAFKSFNKGASARFNKGY